MEKAASGAVANRGRFSPTQFRQVAGEDAGLLNTAARDTLNAPIRNATLPRMLAGAGGYFAPGALAASVLGGAIYNPVGLRLLVQGMGGVLPDSTKAFMAKVQAKHFADGGIFDQIYKPKG